MDSRASQGKCEKKICITSRTSRTIIIILRVLLQVKRRHRLQVTELRINKYMNRLIYIYKDKSIIIHSVAVTSLSVDYNRNLTLTSFFNIIPCFQCIWSNFHKLPYAQAKTVFSWSASHVCIVNNLITFINTNTFIITNFAESEIS